MKQMGWGILFEPQAEAVHLGGGSSADPDLLLHFFKSLYIFYRKHYSPLRLRIARLIVTAMALVKAFRAFGFAAVTQDKTRTRELRREATGWMHVARL
jgi:hypothetical protein